MNRLGFLSTLIGGVALAAAEPVWPFRVFSFPTNIQIEKKIPTSLRFVRRADPRCPGRLITVSDIFYPTTLPVANETDRWKQMADNDLIVGALNA